MRAVVDYGKVLKNRRATMLVKLLAKYPFDLTHQRGDSERVTLLKDLLEDPSGRGIRYDWPEPQHWWKGRRYHQSFKKHDPSGRSIEECFLLAEVEDLAAFLFSLDAGNATTEDSHTLDASVPQHPHWLPWASDTRREWIYKLIRAGFSPPIISNTGDVAVAEYESLRAYLRKDPLRCWTDSWLI